jgi:hypothetical protein
MRYNITDQRVQVPRVDCSHRVGYNSVPYRFTSILPIPHTLFFSACYSACYPPLPPFRNTLLHGLYRLLTCTHRFHIFSPYITLLYLSFLFLFGREKVCNLCNLCPPTVFLNLNLTDGSKTEVCKMYATKRAIYVSKYPQWVQKSGGIGVEMVVGCGKRGCCIDRLHGLMGNWQWSGCCIRPTAGWC